MRCSKTAVTSVCEGVSPFNQIGSHSHKECECVRTSKTLELIPVREGWGLRHIDCSEKRRVICQPQNGKEEKTFELDIFPTVQPTSTVHCSGESMAGPIFSLISA